MTDYLGPQAWRNELTKLLPDTDEAHRGHPHRTEAGLKPRQIAERWGDLGRDKDCTPSNVSSYWCDIDNVLRGVVPRRSRRALDTARVIRQVAHDPRQTARRLREVNPDIPVDTQVRPHAAGERRASNSPCTVLRRARLHPAVPGSSAPNAAG